MDYSYNIETDCNRPSQCVQGYSWECVYGNWQNTYSPCQPAEKMDIIYILGGLASIAGLLVVLINNSNKKK